MMQKSTTFTTILPVKKCHFHYNMQKKVFKHQSFKGCLGNNKFTYILNNDK
jgi:hypothetical protein